MSSRWKTGQSGNPKGRPRKTGPEKIDIRKMIERVFNQRLSVTKGGATESMTMLEAATLQVGRRAANGDLKALRVMLDLAEKFGVDLTEPIKTASFGQASAAKIIADFLARQGEDLRRSCGSLRRPILLMTMLRKRAALEHRTGLAGSRRRSPGNADG